MNERQEADHLAAEILRLTSTIPAHVINAPGVMAARNFKRRVVAARLLATSVKKDLYKLRAAMQDMNQYYQVKP